MNLSTPNKLRVLILGTCLWKAQRALIIRQLLEVLNSRISGRFWVHETKEYGDTTTTTTTSRRRNRNKVSSSKVTSTRSFSVLNEEIEDQEENIYEEQDDDIESQIGLPPLPRLADLYFNFSTVCHIINIICIVLSKLTGDHRGKNTLACLAPRFFIHKSLTQVYMIWFSLLFSSLQAVWRLLMYINGPKISLSVLPFLLASDELINDALDEMKANEAHQADQQLSYHQLIIYQKIEDPTRSKRELTCRPNRTLGSRRCLHAIIDSCFRVVSWIFILSTFVLIPVGLNTAATDHTDLYAGCENTQADYLDPIYVYRASFSAMFSVIQFVDNYNALLLPTSLAVVLISDVLIYWNALERELLRLLVLVANLRFLHDHVENEIERNHSYHRLSQPNPKEIKQLIDDIRLAANCKRQMRDEIFAIQAKLSDFFKHLATVDGWVSIINLFAIIIWLTCNAVITATGLQLLNNTNLILVRTFQSFGFVVLLIISYFILQIKKRTQHAYTTISTIVAYDPSNDKKRWISLLDYYTRSQRYGFTLYDGKLYTELSFFKLISYTVSLIFLYESVKRRD